MSPTTATIVNGIDLSNWQGEVSPESFKEVAQVYNLGFSIHGTQNPDITRVQVANARAGGIPFQELYVWLSRSSNVAGRVRLAVQLAQEYQIGRVALNCEKDPNDGGVAVTWLQVQTAASELEAAGFPVILYTNPDVYATEWGSPPIPQTWETWIADYIYRDPVPASEWEDKKPSALDFQNGTPNQPASDPRYAGLWARCFTWQWQGTTDLGPFSADLNERIIYHEDGDVTQPDNPANPQGPQGPEQPDPRVWIYSFRDEHGLRAIAINGPYTEIYNGPDMPVLRIGSDDGSKPGQLSKLFGIEYEWLTHGDAGAADIGENNSAAEWSRIAGD